MESLWEPPNSKTLPSRSNVGAASPSVGCCPGVLSCVLPRCHRQRCGGGSNVTSSGLARMGVEESSPAGTSGNKCSNRRGTHGLVLLFTHSLQSQCRSVACGRSDDMAARPVHKRPLATLAVHISIGRATRPQSSKSTSVHISETFSTRLFPKSRGRRARGHWM